MRLIFVLLATFVNAAFSYKILVFSPATSKSHLISNGRLADELARAGHDVVGQKITLVNYNKSFQKGCITFKKVCIKAIKLQSVNFFIFRQCWS